MDDNDRPLTQEELMKEDPEFCRLIGWYSQNSQKVARTLGVVSITVKPKHFVVDNGTGKPIRTNDIKTVLK